jgi:hypothetical protein
MWCPSWCSPQFSSSPLQCPSWDRNPTVLKKKSQSVSLHCSLFHCPGLASTSFCLPQTFLATCLITSHICIWFTLALQTDRTWAPLKHRCPLIIPHSIMTKIITLIHVTFKCNYMWYVLHAKVTKFQTVQKCSIDYNVPLSHNTKFSVFFSQIVVLTKQYISHSLLWRP